MNQKVSIIIPTRTISIYLKESIPYLKKLDYEAYEVLILTDDVETYDGLPKNFKIISTGNVGPAEKRNLALKFASCDILAFLDDDAFPEFDWLDNAVKDFSDLNICAVAGPSITPKKVSIKEEASGEVLASDLTSGGTTYRHKKGKRMFVDDYPTVNLLVRFDDFKRIGGFDPEFWPGEDTKLCLDLINKTGKKILYDPEVVVYHHRRELFKPHLKQISRYGVHRGQFARIFPETSRKLQYFIPSLFILGLVFGPVLSLVNRWFLYFYLLALISYIFILLFETARVLNKKKNFLLTFYFLEGVVATHVVYGYSFLYGLFVRPKLNLRAVDKKKGKFLEG